MDEAQWTTVDEYLTDLLAPPDDVLQTALRASENAGLPPIQVTATQGKLLHLLARMMGARRILEIGTLGGYSTIWLGRALPPGGRLVTLESEPIHARVARSNIAHAGLDSTVELRLGPALETLPLLAAENPDPFDLIFIAADDGFAHQHVQPAHSTGSSQQRLLGGVHSNSSASLPGAP